MWPDRPLPFLGKGAFPRGATGKTLKAAPVICKGALGAPLGRNTLEIGFDGFFCQCSRFLLLHAGNLCLQRRPSFTQFYEIRLIGFADV